MQGEWDSRNNKRIRKKCNTCGTGIVVRIAQLNNKKNNAHKREIGGAYQEE
jgi:hypothetical protein